MILDLASNMYAAAIKSDRGRGLKYAQILLDICLIISAPYNESITVLKDLSKSTAMLRSCNKKICEYY